MALNGRIGTSKAAETYDIDLFIDAGSTDDVTYHNFSILKYLNGIEVPITNMLYDYETELEEMCQNYKMSDRAFFKYRYKPWLLAYDFYGSEEASFLIMMLNGILSEREFDFKTVKLIPADEIGTILGRIYSANTDYINNNRRDLAEEEKKDTIGNTVW